jgi:rfaE bifunctional protein nucleotidyltransferase chain/domain
MIIDNGNLQTRLTDIIRLHNMDKLIATTNGCFDLLHVGHIRFLQSIKRIADVLVVCVNSDASVERLKGKGRPIIPLADRMEILDNLKCVDYVVAFDEDTPCEILDKIKPDIHVKDASYTNRDIPEKSVVESNGGIMVFLPKSEGYSTTDIMKTIILRVAEHDLNLVGSCGNPSTIKKNDNHDPLESGSLRHSVVGGMIPVLFPNTDFH